MTKQPSTISECKIALVYDRVNTPHGGAEKVLLALHEVFPKAPLYTSVYDQSQANWASVFNHVIPSWLNQLPFAKNHHRYLVPLMPLCFESFDLSEYNVVISITSAEAKGVLTLPDQLHLCYLLTPTRYLYSHQEEYLTNSNHLQLPGSKWFAKQVFRYLRWWDQTAASRPDYYLPISNLVTRRAKEYYQRDSLPALYPPVEPLALAKNRPDNLLAGFNNYYLVVSRLVGYKRIDLVIKACQALNRPLIIVGDGPEYTQLKKLIETQPQPHLVRMLNHQSPQAVQALLHYATALLMPGIEDFGITALEALNQGTPAVIHHQSGVAELIEDQITGIHLQDLTVNGLMKAIEEVEQTQFSQSAMQSLVAKHQTSMFKQEFLHLVTKLWKDHYVKSS